MIDPDQVNTILVTAQGLVSLALVVALVAVVIGRKGKK